MTKNFQLGDTVCVTSYRKTTDHMRVGGIGTIIDWISDREGFVVFFIVKPFDWPKDKPMRYDNHYYKSDNLEHYTNGLRELQEVLEE
jgi:hypothetical protein